MSATFECWREDYGQTRADARRIKAYDAEDAAREVTRLNFANWDYPGVVEDISVSEVGSDKVEHFEVEVRSEPVFVTRRLLPPSKGTP